MTEDLDRTAHEPEKDAEQRAVGQRLRLARETLGLTQEDVATALAIQRTSVISIEAGKRNVTALELRRLSRLYRRNVAWILGEEIAADSQTEADQALYRATAQLSEADRDQVLRFAEFLAAAGPAPGRRQRDGSSPPQPFARRGPASSNATPSDHSET
jgi:transcriptional regulator with XRE-family HTH domain